MTETETGFSSLGRDGHVIVLAGRVDGTFVITGEAIDLRALAERIFVGSGETPAVEFSRALLSRHVDDAFGFAVNVVDLGKGSTAENGSGNAERNGITLHAFLGRNRAFTGRDPGIGTNETAELVFVLTVLGKAEDLRDAEVVGSTPGHAEGIFGVGIGALIHDRVNNEARAEGTEVILQTETSATLVEGGLGVFSAVSVEGVLCVGGKTAELRGDVRDGVVHAVTIAEVEQALGADRVAPTRTEGSVAVHDVVGTNAGGEGADTTHGKRTERPRLGMAVTFPPEGRSVQTSAQSREIPLQKTSRSVHLRRSAWYRYIPREVEFRPLQAHNFLFGRLNARAPAPHLQKTEDNHGRQLRQGDVPGGIHRARASAQALQHPEGPGLCGHQRPGDERHAPVRDPHEPQRRQDRGRHAPHCGPGAPHEHHLPRLGAFSLAQHRGHAVARLREAQRGRLFGRSVCGSVRAVLLPDDGPDGAQYLSKLELGSRTMTDAVEASLIREYNLRGEDVKALRKARAESNEEVKFNSNNSLPTNKVEMLKELQSAIGTMSDEDVRAVLRVLNKHKPRGIA